MSSAPGLSGFGEHVNDTGLSCWSGIFVEMVVDSRDAVTVTVSAARIGEAVAVNVRDVAVAGMVIVAGTVTDATLLVSVIVFPPDGAAPDSETVHVVLVPPISVDGVHASALTVTDAAATVNCTVLAREPIVAVRVAVPTADVEGVAVNWAATAPALMRTDAGI